MKALTILIIPILIAGCTAPPLSNQDWAKQMCEDLCKAALNQGYNLSAGPCLSNEIVDDWVCDVAHSPRQDIDNLPENQCPAYGKTARHFVEVDPECRFIRAV
jgi:hypothetical protein